MGIADDADFWADPDDRSLDLVNANPKAKPSMPASRRQKRATTKKKLPALPFAVPSVHASAGCGNMSAPFAECTQPVTRAQAALHKRAHTDTGAAGTEQQDFDDGMFGADGDFDGDFFDADPGGHGGSDGWGSSAENLAPQVADEDTFSGAPEPLGLDMLAVPAAVQAGKV